MVHQVQAYIFIQLLDRGCVINIGLICRIIAASRSQPVHQLWGKVKTLTALLVAAQTYHVRQPGIHPKLAVAKFRQPRKVVLIRITVGRHTHHLVLAVQHVKTQVLGNRPV